MIRIAAIGDTNVDCYLKSGLMYPGGNCLNVSIFARRFGAESAFIGAVGPDHAGQFIRQSLQSAEVDASRLRTKDGCTAYCLIDHVEGDRVFRASDLGVSRFQPSREDLDYLQTFDAAHVGQTSGLDAFVPVIARNTRLSYDFSTDHELSHYQDISRHCYLASFSAGELSSSEISTIQTKVLEAGAKWVLMTRGREGAILCNKEMSYEVPAAPSQVADTLGAGDTFITRTLIGLLRGDPPEEILHASALAAAHTCSYLGPHSQGTQIELQQDVTALLGQ